MKKVVLFLVYVVISKFGSAQTKEDISLFKFELGRFIDTVKENAILDGKYDVYVASLYTDNTGPLCFTLSHMFNTDTNTYDVINPTHYLLINDEYVLLKYSRDINADVVSHLNALPINTNIKNTVLKKMCHSEDGGIHYISGSQKGLVGCITNGKVSKKFYRSAYEIPNGLSVFPPFSWDDYIIEKVDSNLFEPKPIK